MRSTKIVQFLLAFSARDLKRFREFLDSPFFNRQKDILALFDILQARILNKPKRGHLSEEEAWEHLYPGKEINIPSFRMLRTQLLKLAMDFLSYDAFSKSEVDRKAVLLRQLNVRQFDSIFEKELAAGQTWMEENLEDEPDHLVANFLINRESFSYKINRFQRETADAVALNGLLNSIDDLTRVTKLKFLGSYLANRNKVAKKQSPERELPAGFQSGNEWESYIDTYAAKLLAEVETESDLVARTFRKALILQMDSDDEEAFHELKEELMQLPSSFSSVDAYDLFTHARNFCVLRINAGEESFLQAYHELNREMLNRGLLEEELKIIPDLFVTIVEIDSILGEFGFLRSFMRQYQSYLPEFAREIAVVYCTAIMEFYQGNFEEAESLLLRVVDQEFDGFVSGVKARTYLLKTYFEQGKYDEMEKLLNSFRMYVRRNKLLTAGSKQNYTRRINSMRKLMNLSLLPFESDKVKQFGSELQAQKSPAVHKKWMLRKVNEMS